MQFHSLRVSLTSRCYDVPIDCLQTRWNRRRSRSKAERDKVNLRVVRGSLPHHRGATLAAAPRPSTHHGTHSSPVPTLSHARRPQRRRSIPHLSLLLRFSHRQRRPLLLLPRWHCTIMGS